jgi:hypothetical protein
MFRAAVEGTRRRSSRWRGESIEAAKILGVGKKEREHDKHAAGGPGKSARKGHVEPEKSGNKPGQRQEGAVKLLGAGRHSGPQKREPGKSGKAR